MKETLVKVLHTHQFAHWGPYLAVMGADPVFCKKLLEHSKTLKIKYNKSLAGQLEHENLYDVKKNPWIEEGLRIYVDTWIEGFRRFSLKNNFNPNPKICSMWVNHQKAGEYNPVHVHTGSDVSFVLWLKVPKKILQESSDVPQVQFDNPGAEYLAAQLLNNKGAGFFIFAQDYECVGIDGFLKINPSYIKGGAILICYPDGTSIRIIDLSRL